MQPLKAWNMHGNKLVFQELTDENNDELFFYLEMFSDEECQLYFFNLPPNEFLTNDKLADPLNTK